MANCTITGGIDIICADLRRTGGIAKNVWLFNITNLRAAINVDSEDYITTIELNTYATLYRFEGAKFAHSASSNLAKTDSGNVSFTHELNMKVFNTNPTDDVTLQNLTVAEVGAVIQTNNDEFFIYGAGNGLSASSVTTQTGKNAGDDSTTTVVLTGSERTLPKRFLVTNKTLTLAWLNAHVA